MFAPARSVVTVTEPTNKMVSTVFYVFNFPEFRGQDDYIIQRPDSGAVACGLIRLRADGWIVEIAATENTHDRVKALKREGGYVITHMARVRREHGLKFSAEDLESLLCCLHSFLSFALGRWAGVALPCGFDEADNSQ